MKDTKTPRWMLERLALGELDAKAARELRQRAAAAGEDLDAALAELTASNAEILADHPPARMAEAIRRRAEPPVHPRRARTIWAVAPVALAGAMALVLLVRPAGEQRRPAEPREIITVKGPEAAHLVAYRNEHGEARLLGDGAAAAQGDLIQLAYRKQHAGFGLLLSIDGAGTVTLHWPDKPSTGAAPLETSGETRLPSSYQLDDAPGFERFFLVTATQPFPIATVVDAARALAARPQEARTSPLPLPPTFAQTSLALAKPGATRVDGAGLGPAKSVAGGGEHPPRVPAVNRKELR